MNLIVRSPGIGLPMLSSLKLSLDCLDCVSTPGSASDGSLLFAELFKSWCFFRIEITLRVSWIAHCTHGIYWISFAGVLPAVSGGFDAAV